MPFPTRQQWLFVATVLRDHGRRRWWIYCATFAVFSSFGAHYRLGINLSDSLPGRVYLIVLGAKPSAVDDYVAFEWQRNQFYQRNCLFIKRVAGLPGQTVDVRQRAVFIDDKPVGYAKRRSRKGVPLTPIDPGVIPGGSLFAAAPHPDSLDSRYRITGLIHASRIVGKAYALF